MYETIYILLSVNMTLVCTPCTKADDWFDCLGKDFKLDCSSRLCMLNETLLEMRSDIYKFKVNIITQPFTGAGHQVFVTEYPIYDIEGFYACGCSTGCSGDIFYELDNKCVDCGCCPGVKGLHMYDGLNTDICTCQYNFCRDGKQLEANFHSSVQSGYFRYYRGFDPLESLDDCIPLQKSLLPGLKMLMMSYYLPKSGTSYQGDDVNYRTLYNNFIEKQKDRDVFRIKEIKGHRDF